MCFTRSQIFTAAHQELWIIEIFKILPHADFCEFEKTFFSFCQTTFLVLIEPPEQILKFLPENRSSS